MAHPSGIDQLGSSKILALPVPVHSVAQHQRYWFYLIILAALLYLPGLGARDFWAPVEPRYAEIARVMFSKGEWLVPTINGELYTDKPILYFWLVLIASKIAGSVNEWTVRLPAALSGIGFVLTTYLLGREFFDARTGFMAAAIVATTVRVIWEARWAHVDMIFALFFSLSIYFAARSLLRRGTSNEILLGYVFMALATLSKGLIGVVLPGLIVGFFIVARRDWRLLGELRLPSGVAIFLALAAPWFLLVGAATDGKWLSDFIYIHHLQRYTQGSGHRQPFYYYFITLPVDFLPWTIFAIAALISGTRRANWRQPVNLFLLVWFLMVFVFFSMSDTKRDLYLLPLFPAAALVVGRYFDCLVSGKLPETKLQRVLARIFFGAVAISAVGLPIVIGRFHQDALSISLPVAFSMLCAALATLYFIRRSHAWNVFLSVALTVLVTTVSAIVWVLPYVNRFKSPRPLALAVKREVPSTARLYIYADSMHDFNFYIQREVIPVLASAAELDSLLSAHQTSYVLVRDRDLRRLRPTPMGKTILSESIGDKGWHLFLIGNADSA